MNPEQQLAEAVNHLVPAEVTHIGLLTWDATGRLRARIPQGFAYGVKTTFPRIPRERDELPRETLNRLGIQTGCFPLEGIKQTPNSTTMYFATSLREVGRDDPSAGFLWLAPDELQVRLEASGNVTSRTRDLAVLAQAQGICPIPWRRVLLMVAELHRLGYECLRIHPYNYHYIAWRCEILPRHWTQRENGVDRSPDTYGYETDYPTPFIYSSGMDQVYFKWNDALFASPRELALLFIERYPDIRVAGWGKDPEYVRWYQALLERSAPLGVPLFRHAENELEIDLGHATVTFPLPPR